MALGLERPAHHAVAELQPAPVQDHAGDDRVEGALAGPVLVRMAGFEGEAGAAAVEHDAGGAAGDRRSEGREQGVDEGGGVAVAIDDGQVDRVGTRQAGAAGAGRDAAGRGAVRRPPAVDQGAALAGVCLVEQFRQRHASARSGAARPPGRRRGRGGRRRPASSPRPEGGCARFPPGPSRRGRSSPAGSASGERPAPGRWAATGGLPGRGRSCPPGRPRSSGGGGSPRVRASRRWPGRSGRSPPRSPRGRRRRGRPGRSGAASAPGPGRGTLRRVRALRRRRASVRRPPGRGAAGPRTRATCPGRVR